MRGMVVTSAFVLKSLPSEALLTDSDVSLHATDPASCAKPSQSGGGGCGGLPSYSILRQTLEYPPTANLQPSFIYHLSFPPVTNKFFYISEPTLERSGIQEDDVFKRYLPRASSHPLSPNCRYL